MSNHVNKLYTKTGDAGKTSLYDEKNVYKFAPVFDLLGGFDEISAHLGMCASITQEKYTYLRKIQSILLDIGSYMSTNKNKLNCTVTEEDIKEIESFIDEYQAATPPLKEFILPGVTQADSAIQICRTVVRRTERLYWELIYKIEENYKTPYNAEWHSRFLEKQPAYLIMGKYLNRLSDYLFALARVVCEAKEVTRSQAVSSFHRPPVKPSKDA